VGRLATEAGKLGYTLQRTVDPALGMHGATSC
jgi:hypothetical protein